MRIVGIVGGDHRFEIGGDLDETVFRAHVEQRDAAGFGIMLGRDDALHLACEVADNLGELRLLVGEFDLDLFAFDALRL